MSAYHMYAAHWGNGFFTVQRWRPVAMTEREHAAYAAVQPAICEWFALCDHPATGNMPHPVLGQVPICDRCRTRIEAM